MAIRVGRRLLAAGAHRALLRTTQTQIRGYGQEVPSVRSKGTNTAFFKFVRSMTMTRFAESKHGKTFVQWYKKQGISRILVRSFAFDRGQGVGGIIGGVALSFFIWHTNSLQMDSIETKSFENSRKAEICYKNMNNIQNLLDCESVKEVLSPHKVKKKVKQEGLLIFGIEEIKEKGKDEDKKVRRQDKWIHTSGRFAADSGSSAPVASTETSVPNDSLNESATSISSATEATNAQVKVAAGGGLSHESTNQSKPAQAKGSTEGISTNHT